MIEYEIPDPLVEQFQALEREVRLRRLTALCEQQGHDWLEIQVFGVGDFQMLCRRCGKRERL